MIFFFLIWLGCRAGRVREEALAVEEVRKVLTSYE